MGITLSFDSVLVRIRVADNEFSNRLPRRGATSAEGIVPAAGSDVVARTARPWGCPHRPVGPAADCGGPGPRSLVDERDAGRLRRVHWRSRRTPLPAIPRPRRPTPRTARQLPRYQALGRCPDDRSSPVSPPADHPQELLDVCPLV